LAWSAVLSGHDESALEALERLHQLRLDGGEVLRAARAAFWLALRLTSLGEFARASGWLVRAQRLVDREGQDSVEGGYLRLPHVFRHVALAAGGGVLHEPGGVNVLLARVAAGRNTDAWLVHGNVLFQKPMSSARDALDLVTSVGWARKLPHGVSLGVEAIGEDLDGFWESTEAEGGARLLAGPSLHISPAGQRWQLIATGGPLFHPSDTGRSSGAFRDQRRRGLRGSRSVLTRRLLPGRGPPPWKGVVDFLIQAGSSRCIPRTPCNIPETSSEGVRGRGEEGKRRPHRHRAHDSSRPANGGRENL
jgi:hypothetical protein